MSAPSSPRQNSGDAILPLRINKSQQTQRKIFESLQEEKAHKTKVAGSANTRDIRSFWTDLEKKSDKFTPKPPQSNVYNSPNPQVVNSSPHFSSLEFRESMPGYEPPPGSLGRPLKQVIRRGNSISRLHGPREFSPQPGMASPSSDYGSPAMENIDYAFNSPEPEFEFSQKADDTMGEEANLTRSKSKKNVTFNMEPPSIVTYETLTPEIGCESPLTNSDEEYLPHEDDLNDNHPVIEPRLDDFYNDDIITPISAPRRPLPMIPQVDLVESESSGEEDVIQEPLPTFELDSPSLEHSVKAVYTQRSLSDSKLNMIENTIDDAIEVTKESRRLSQGPDSKEYIHEALVDHQLPVDSPMVGSFTEYEHSQYEAQHDRNGRLVIPVNLSRKESLLDNERKISTKHHVPTIDSNPVAQLNRRVSQRRRSVIKALENESKPAEGVIEEDEEEEEEEDEEEDEEDDEEEDEEEDEIEEDKEENVEENSEEEEQAEGEEVVPEVASEIMDSHTMVSVAQESGEDEEGPVLDNSNSDEVDEAEDSSDVHPPVIEALAEDQEVASSSEVPQEDEEEPTSLSTPTGIPNSDREAEASAGKPSMAEQAIPSVKAESDSIGHFSSITVKPEPMDFDPDEILRDIPFGDLSASNESGRFSFGPETSFSVKKSSDIVPEVPTVPAEHLTAQVKQEQLDNVLGDLVNDNAATEEELSQEEAESLTKPQSSTFESGSGEYSDTESIDTPLVVNKLRNSAHMNAEVQDPPAASSSLLEFSLPQHRDFTPLTELFESSTENAEHASVQTIASVEQPDITPRATADQLNQLPEAPVDQYDEVDEANEADEAIEDAALEEGPAPSQAALADVKTSDEDSDSHSIKQEEIPVKTEQTQPTIANETDMGLLTALNDTEVAQAYHDEAQMPVDAPVEEQEEDDDACSSEIDQDDVAQDTPKQVETDEQPSAPVEEPTVPVVASVESAPVTYSVPKSMIIDDTPPPSDTQVATPRERMSVPRVPVGGASEAVAPSESLVPTARLPRDPTQVGFITALYETEPDEASELSPVPPMPANLPDILPPDLAALTLEEADEATNVEDLPAPQLPTPNFHTPLSNFDQSPDLAELNSRAGVNNSIVPDQVSVMPEWTETEGDVTAPGLIAVGADLADTTRSISSTDPVNEIASDRLDSAQSRFDSAQESTGRFDSAQESTGRFDSAQESEPDPIKRDFSQYSLTLDHSPQQEFGDQFKEYQPDIMQDIPVKEEYVDEEQQTIKMKGKNNSIRARKSLAANEVSRFSHARRKISGDFTGLTYNDTMQDLSSHSSESLYDEHLQREISQPPVKLTAPKLEFSIEDLTGDTDSMFADLENEFDRVISVQKRGYSLRENNRIVIANGPAREINRRLSGPVSKWPGNNVEQPTPEMPTVPEQYQSMVSDVAPKKQEGAKSVPAPADIVKSKKSVPSSQRMPNVESGRLFVRVLGIKDLELPGIDSKNAVMSLTMDNGIHCITTPYQTLRRSTRLDQEFELTVKKDLEFILTLRTRWKRRATPSIAPSIQSNSSLSTKNKLGKLFGKKSEPRLNPAQPVVAADPWDSITAKDGSFGRSYIAFAQYEQEIYGKPGVFEVNCFNEWSETNGKKRQPYKIAKLEMELMYIPRGSKNETLPVSIEAALETLKEAGVKTQIETEGFMSQHGGDCKYWRRRYFTLRGATLTAYSETSRKPRATINLAKAVSVICDKSTLSQPTVEVGRDKQRRKSVFASDSEGFMFANEGFRIRFANGEIIDFYADSKEIKDHWVTELRKVIGTQIKAQPWVDLVLARREYEKNAK